MPIDILHRLPSTPSPSVPLPPRGQSSKPEVSAEKNSPDEPKPHDAFDRGPRPSWLEYSGGPHQVVAPRVMQARAAGASAPADVGPGTSLSDAVYCRARHLPKDEKHKPIRALYAEADKLAKSGDYAKAADKLERALSRYEEEIDASKALGTGGVAGTSNLAAQYRVLADMKARGVEASNPPTLPELEKYFGSFDSRAERPAALTAFGAYTEAFYVHPASVGRPDEDITYSKDPSKYSVGKTIYGSEADANRAQEKSGGTRYEFTTADASEWKDVTTDRDTVGLEGGHSKSAGKRVIDCEGYAYLGEKLLGAAGYKTEQVAVQSKKGEQHAMTMLIDPSRKDSVAVVSNAEILTAASKKAALDLGFQDAMPAGAEAGPYFYGSSQHEAQVKMLHHHRKAS